MTCRPPWQVRWAIELACTVGAAVTWLVQLRDLFDGLWRALNELKKSQVSAPS